MGNDALQVTRRGAVTVPLRDIVDVTPLLHLVNVRRPDGSVGPLEAAPLGVSSFELRDATSPAARQDSADLRGTTAFHRNDLPIERWREAVLARAAGATDLRDQDIDRDDLLAALQHPAATVEERVGAALALTPGLRGTPSAFADGRLDHDAIRHVAASGEGGA